MHSYLDMVFLEKCDAAAIVNPIRNALAEKNMDLYTKEKNMDLYTKEKNMDLYTSASVTNLILHVILILN